MNCFGKNFIGILGDCEGCTPSSGLYINHLTGVDLCTASMVANEEFDSGVKLLRSLEQTAIKLTTQHFFSKLSNYYDYETSTTIKTVGVHDDNFEENFFEGEMGVEIENHSTDELQDLFIEYVEINSSANYQNVPYRIIDGCNSKEGTINLCCGVNRLPIECFVSTRTMKVVFDVTGIEELPSYAKSSGGDCCSCIKTCGCHSSCFSTHYIQKETIDESFEYAGNGAKIVVAGQCCCSEEKLICKFKKKLGTAVWYHFGALLMAEVQHSKRANPLVRNMKESAAQLYVKWLGGTNSFTGMAGEALYWKELSRVVKQAKKSVGKIQSDCINCSSTKIITQIP